jgi:hypothetical protein
MTTATTTTTNAMNIAKFQFCINHVDPAIVKAGLEGFAHQVLQDHHALAEFGYCGRSESYDPEEILYGSRDKYTQAKYQVRGLLATYLAASPKCEELFVLWSIPERNIDKQLCAAHMHCFASIFHCARRDSTMRSILHALAYRILDPDSNFSFSCLESLRTQLNTQAKTDSFANELVHASLGVCIEMACLSKLVACRLLENVVFAVPKYNTQTGSVETQLSTEFLNCLKHGNSVKWACRGTDVQPTEKQSTEDIPFEPQQENKEDLESRPTVAAATAVDRTAARTFEIDTRYLVYLLVMQTMISIDDEEASVTVQAPTQTHISKLVHQVLAGSYSPLKKLVSGISKDSLSCVRMVLTGFMLIQQRSRVADNLLVGQYEASSSKHRDRGGYFAQLCVSVFGEFSLLQKVVFMYKHKMKKLQETVHGFMKVFVADLCSPSCGNTSFRLHMASTVIKLLEGHVDIRHREVSFWRFW